MTQPDLLTSVVKAVADADGVDPEEVDILYDYIDPSVLSILEEQDRGVWSFTFQFADHQVTTTHESTIFVDGVKYAPDTTMK